MNISFKSIAKSTLMIIGACVVFGEVKSCYNKPDKYFNKVKKEMNKTEMNINKALKSLSQTKAIYDYNLSVTNYAKGLQMVKNTASKLV